MPGGAISGNTLVWRQVTFTALTTTKIRIFVTGAQSTWTRITEVEAYSTAGAAVNVPPTVTLTGPAEAATYTAPATIAFAANAADSDGTVKRVDFYANGTLVGSDATSPYQFAWTATIAGNYTLTAVAVDNLDVSTTSAPVHVTVTQPAGRTNVALATNGAVAIGVIDYRELLWPGRSDQRRSEREPVGQRRRLERWDARTHGRTGWKWISPEPKTIDEVDVFSLQDNYASPVEPTPAMTFTQYGLTDFTVQYWDGTQLPGRAGRRDQREYAGVATGELHGADDDEDSHLRHGGAVDVDPDSGGGSVLDGGGGP